MFEGDILSTELTLGAIDKVELAGDACSLLDLRALVLAHRAGADGPAPVLDWRFVGLMA